MEIFTKPKFQLGKLKCKNHIAEIYAYALHFEKGCYMLYLANRILRTLIIENLSLFSKIT